MNSDVLQQFNGGWPKAGASGAQLVPSRSEVGIMRTAGLPGVPDSPTRRVPRQSAVRLGRLWALAALACAVSFTLAAQPAKPGNPNDFSAFKIITDRNIFDPNRRPHIVAQAEQPIVDSFSLAGTMSYEKGFFAVFDGSSSDYHKVLETGGSIAGYLVKDIRLNTVKLSSGTNELELAVGMQMRRNGEGRWSTGEQQETPGSSVASNSSSRRRSSRRQSTSRADSQPAGAPAVAPDMADPGGTTNEPALDATIAPPDAIEGDPNDPVARMMQRRAQDLNGNQNRNPNQ